MEKEEKVIKRIKISNLEQLQRRGNLILSSILLGSVLCPILYLNVNFKKFDVIEGFFQRIISSLIFSLIAFVITFNMIPVFMQINYAKKIFGVDINKIEDITNKEDPDRKEVPESLGIVPATVFLITTILFQVFLNLDDKNVNFYLFLESLLQFCFTLDLFYDFLGMVRRYFRLKMEI